MSYELDAIAFSLDEALKNLDCSDETKTLFMEWFLTKEFSGKVSFLLQRISFLDGLQAKLAECTGVTINDSFQNKKNLFFAYYHLLENFDSVPESLRDYAEKVFDLLNHNVLNNEGY